MAILSRAWPPRRGRPIRLDLPRLDAPGATAAALAAVIEATARGHLTPEEGEAVAKVLALRTAALDALDLERRLNSLEARLGDDEGPAP